MPALTVSNDAIRAEHVTASECYALLGYHPYMTRLDIYNRLVRPEIYWSDPRRQQSEAMRLGLFLEAPIARYASLRLGIKVRANKKTIPYPGGIVRLAATPDYFVLRESMLMEVKLSSILYGWNEDELSPHIEYQARAQMACTDKASVLIVAVVGSQFYMVPVIRDVDKEEQLLLAVADFWDNHIYRQIPPPDDKAEGDERFIRKVQVR